MSTKINIPLNYTPPWVCPTVPADKRSLLIKNTNELKVKISLLNDTIMSYENVTEQKSLGQQIKFANEYNE